MNKKQVEYLQYKFSDAEIRVLSQDAGRIDQEMKTLENRLDQIKKSLAGELAEKKTELSKLMAKMAGGFEYRNVDCEVKLDTPKQGQASIVRLDTEEVIKVRRMTDEELQIPLPMEAEPVEAEPVEAEPVEAEPVEDPPAVEEPAAEAVLALPCALRTYSHEKEGGRFDVTVIRDEAGDIRWEGAGYIPDADAVEWMPDKTYVSEVLAAKDAMIAVWQWAYSVNGATSKPITKAASLGLSVYASEVVSKLREEAGG